MVHRRRLVSAAVLAGAALALLAWMGHSQEPVSSAPFVKPEFVEADCPMSFDRPRGVHVDCGYVSVLEDRGKHDGNVIRLAVAKLRGSIPSPHPDPVIYLAGGPGTGVMERIDRFIDDARFIWKERDLVLLDQRGVGHSEPRLECPDFPRLQMALLDRNLDADEKLQRGVEALLACRRTLSEQGIDMSAYTPEAVAADVPDVARAMGYETYNLYGSSFGSMLALTVMRDFPEYVRAAILDGVLPRQVNATETLYANTAAAIEALFRHCEADPKCAERYPALEQDLWQLVDSFPAHPITIRKSDPDSAESFEVEVDGHFILRRVLDSLRSDSWIPYLPFLLHRIARGDSFVAGRFIGPYPRVVWTPDSSAAWASLRCHADGRFADLSRVLADRAAHPRLVDPQTPDLAPAICAAWQDPTVEAVDKTPVASDIPTLLLSGQFDPTTPPRWADLAAETLSRSHSFVVPMAGHGVGMATPCGRELAGAFLSSPGADPSPACSAARRRSGFRTIFLLRPMPRWSLGPPTILVLGVPFILMLHLSALIIWPAGSLIRRIAFGREVSARWVRYPRITVAAIIALSVGVWWSVRAAEEFLLVFLTRGLPDWVKRLLSFAVDAPDKMRWLTDDVVRDFGYYAWAMPLFYMPYLLAAATAYVLYLAFRSWRKNWWTGLGRAHYGIVAITLAWYPFHLYALGFIL